MFRPPFGDADQSHVTQNLAATAAARFGAAMDGPGGPSYMVLLQPERRRGERRVIRAKESTHLPRSTPRRSVSSICCRHHSAPHHSAIFSVTAIILPLPGHRLERDIVAVHYPSDKFGGPELATASSSGVRWHSEVCAMTQSSIISDSTVMMGKPVVAGTRITVELILEKLGAGETLDQLLESHPRLSKDAVMAALDFAARALRADVIYPIVVDSHEPARG
jgi:uncharacterized protein (DUF433 family)